jgi:3-methyladenine DNA glycosylase AlkC
LAQGLSIELELRKREDKMVTKVEEVKNLVELGIKQPEAAFPKIRQLAHSDDWKVREVAATCLVEISKKKSDEVIQGMVCWADDSNPNVRRTSSEGLRDVARRNPDKVLSVIEKLNEDNNLYVKKSVANVLRNASRYNPNLVFELCQKWALPGNPNTNWIIKDAIKKLPPEQQKEILSLLKRP